MAPQNFSRSRIHCEKFTEVAAGFRMLVIGASHRARAAFPDNLLDRSKGCLLAAEIDWNVERVRLRIHLNDSLITEIRSVNELTVRPIELPENSELAHFEKGLASCHIDQDALEYFVHVLRL